MKSALITAACIGLAAYPGTSPLLAQLRDNSEKQMTCENGGYDSDHVRHCEIREQSVPGVGRLTIDQLQNGGATVKGWLRSDVLVRARVDTAADTESAAAAMASRVLIDSSGGQVRAMGPDSANNSWWSVSYEVFVPQNSDLNLKGTNGGVTVSDVRGQIHFDVTNGGVHLKRVAGDVSGATVNGGIQVELAGATWDGRQMELTTHNGGVTVAMPPNYSAHLQAETGLGSIHSDFPVTMQGVAGQGVAGQGVAGQGNVRPRLLDFSVGAGGPLIHITTGNGGIKLTRTDLQ
jgi:hypothetical protein